MSRVDAPSPSSGAERANSRAALIEAAFEEFTTKGYEAATVAGIAERAGVTTGALYAHFAGKLSLLIETVGLTPVEDVVRSATATAALPWSELSKMFTQGISTTPDRGRLLLLDVIVVARREPHVAEILRRGLEGYVDAMTRGIEAWSAQGVVEPTIDGEELSRLLLLVNFGMLVFAALEERPPSAVAFGRLADLLFHEGEPSPALARVQARAIAAERARGELHDAIEAAVAAGHSLRQVGSAAALSHERVRQVLRERHRQDP